jgi:hypothetical protein
MKRRKFIWRITGAGGAIAGLGAVFFSTSLKDAVSNKIQSELSFLKLDPDGLDQFVADYTKNISTAKKASLYGYAALALSSKRSLKIRKLINVYLLSTDYFQNNMDDTRVVKYIALYDPRVRPCVNPFSGHHYTV